MLSPQNLVDRLTSKVLVISEIEFVGDVVIRWVSGDFDGPMLPNYELLSSEDDFNMGLIRIDHVVTNVPNLFKAFDYLNNAIGLHELSEFISEDIGTVDSGLNSIFLSNNNEHVILSVIEPTFGTKRKSQIQNYLEHNCGPGVQHVAFLTEDIISSVSEIRKRSLIGGMEFMDPPNNSYYDRVESRIGVGVLTQQQFDSLKRLGILADRDDQGILLQIFTKPIGDRPTIFFEIIQRICMAPNGKVAPPRAACGGFGKGNFGELFKSIENFEKQFDQESGGGVGVGIDREDT